MRGDPSSFSLLPVGTRHDAGYEDIGRCMAGIRGIVDSRKFCDGHVGVRWNSPERLESPVRSRDERDTATVLYREICASLIVLRARRGSDVIDNMRIYILYIWHIIFSHVRRKRLPV